MRIYSQNIWGNFSSKECIGNRNFLIHQLIEKYQPDFCCFQECNPSTSRKDNSISILLKDNYDEVLLENENKNFTPIFYNRNKVNFVCGEYVVYSGLNDWDSKSFTWGLFENLENKERVVVISTHLWWKYTGEVDILQRRENVKQLMDVVNRLYLQYEVPIIVCGDFNSGEKAKQGPDAYYQMIKNNMVDVRNIALESSNSETCSLEYPKHDSDGFYYQGVQPCITIDYIFVNKEELILATSFKIDNSQIARDSSDHSPLIFEFELKSK